MESKEKPKLYKFIINNEVFQDNLTYEETEKLYYDLIDSGYIRIEKEIEQ